MTDITPSVLLPGLFCTPRLYAEQITPLWQFGPVMVADHKRHESMRETAASILEHAPPRFALLGHSMGGYLAFEIWRQAPQRILKLTFIDTSARPDTPEQTKVREGQIALANAGEFGKVVSSAIPLLLHNNEALRAVIRQMSEDTGHEAFTRQQRAIIGRKDSRPDLAEIKCPTLVIVGEQDRLIPLDRSKEIADGIAGSEFVVIPNCGHLPTLEQPMLTTQALVRWMQR